MTLPRARHAAGPHTARGEGRVLPLPEKTNAGGRCKLTAGAAAERDALWNSIVPTGFILLVSFLLVVGLCR